MALLCPFWGNTLVPHFMGDSGCSWFVIIQAGGGALPNFYLGNESTWGKHSAIGSKSGWQQELQQSHSGRRWIRWGATDTNNNQPLTGTATRAVAGNNTIWGQQLMIGGKSGQRWERRWLQWTMVGVSVWWRQWMARWKLRTMVLAMDNDKVVVRQQCSVSSG